MRETTELRGLVDLQQEVITAQMWDRANQSLAHDKEINHLNEMLQLQSDTIRQQGSIIEAHVQDIERLQAELDSYDFISDWVYKPWQSKQELKEWLWANDVSEQEYIPKTHDCDDFAIELSMSALADGRIIGIMREPGHQFNWAIVGNDIYQIEPQTDIVELIGRVD
jgi:hypothetical protein